MTNHINHSEKQGLRPNPAMLLCIGLGLLVSGCVSAAANPWQEAHYSVVSNPSQGAITEYIGP